MPDELLIGYNPMPATQKVAYWAAMIRSRIVWLFISAAVTVIIWAWRKNSLTPGLVIALFAAGIGYSVVWLVITIVGWARAKGVLSSIPDGLAARIDRVGISLQGMSIPWDGVDTVIARRGRLGGAPTLRVKAVTGQEARVPISLLDVLLGTIDASIRSFSQGVHRVDTSKLGN